MVKLFGFLLLVGVVLTYWQWIALAVVLVWLWKMAPRWWGAYQVTQAARRDRVAAIIARADQQHRWAMAGDPKGTFGEYLPARLVEVMPVLPGPSTPSCYRCRAQGHIVPATRSWGEGAEVCDPCDAHLEGLRA